jgi:putative effector of murein hydrolase LrgA (UPF0299 family)
MHGLGWSRAVRWVVGLAYIALVGVLYAGQWARAITVLGIPATIIPGALLLSALVVAGLRLAASGAARRVPASG